jgi:hypothetical protein
MRHWQFVLAVCLVAPVFAEEAPSEEPITAENREHWSFQPLADVAPPAVTDAAWCRSPIDRFLLKELEEHSLAPMPDADRRTLLRRVTFDLTGLPPTLAEQEAFVHDDREGAYEHVVDELLARPEYAERWAQHWLDAARYADTDGFELDAVRQNAWRYRDWVISAFAADLPYREFVRQQLAGDLIHPDDPESLIATGFLLCGPDMPDINLQEERRHNFLNDLTSTVGQVFLGLQMGCASCHDHKYDPISQFDFYRLRAFFEPCDLFREQPLMTADDRAAIKQFELDRAKRWIGIEKERSKLSGDREANAERLKELDDELAKLKKARPPAVTMGRVVKLNSSRSAAHFFVRGDFRRVGPEVEPAFPRVVASPTEKAGGARQDELDREALANWITSPDNAIASRVIVNRIWQFHFGRGLCDTPSDLGFMGGVATHPELLDWLAAEFQRNGGHFKALHRLIVTSSAYRTASRPVANEPQWSVLTEQDSTNRWLGRMRRQRLDGESLRDSMLAVAGRLNLECGGPGVRPPLPSEVVETLLRDQWIVTPEPGQHVRRSIYLFARRNLTFPMFEVFDRPDANQSCARRHESTTAPQALTLLNSAFTWDCASDVAQHVQSETSTRNEQVDLACRLILGRPAQADDFEIAGSDVDLVTYCAALFNSSEFLYVD